MRWTSCSATSSTAASRRAAAAASSRRSTSTTSATRRGRSCAPIWPASTRRSVELEIRGRELILGGQRVAPAAGQERLYQQLEIEYGPFRRVVALGADVDAERARATYEDGMLVVELPIAAPADPHAVPIEPGRRRRASGEGEP